jgi:uncharacterized protein
VTCPTCKHPVDRAGKAAPFCTDRCRMVDLGKWFGEQYRIPGEPVDPTTLAPPTEE